MSGRALACTSPGTCEDTPLPTRLARALRSRVCHWSVHKGDRLSQEPWWSYKQHGGAGCHAWQYPGYHEPASSWGDICRVNGKVYGIGISWNCVIHWSWGSWGSSAKNEQYYALLSVHVDDLNVHEEITQYYTCCCRNLIWSTMTWSFPPVVARRNLSACCTVCASSTRSMGSLWRRTARGSTSSRPMESSSGTVVAPAPVIHTIQIWPIHFFSVNF